MSYSNLILNRFFSKKTLQSILQNREDLCNTYYATIKRYTDSYKNKTNKELISEIYAVVKNTYRNEYFYKNTLLNNLLFKSHNPLTTTALTEIPIAKSIADFILINGKATVYEIKTELDSFERLDSQLSDYYKSFDNVCVVVSEKKLDAIKEKLSNSNVGIYYLSKRGALKKYREPVSCMLDLDHECLFKILRKYEYEQIVSKYFSLPDVPQYRYYSECKALFEKIPLDNVYQDFKYILKQRVNLKLELFSSIPKELKAVAYFSRLKDSDYRKISSFLEEKYGV